MPALRPDLEKSIRVSLENVGVQLLEIVGAACCPAYGTFYSVDEEAALAVNAWNLALAEKNGADIVVQCGSCYSTLKVGRHKLLNGKLDLINEKYLSKVGLKYEGEIDVRHLTDVLYNMVGVEKIRKSLKYSLEGLVGVVQNPCHVLRPSKIVAFDDPENPVVLKNLTKALGAEVKSFEREKQCCGGAGGFTNFDKKASLEFLKKKFDSMKEEVDPDFIVTCCITCLMHMDEAQEEMRRLGMIDYSIPVFDICQLLAICQGCDPKKVVRMWKTPGDEVVKRILENKI